MRFILASIISLNMAAAVLPAQQPPAQPPVAADADDGPEMTIEGILLRLQLHYWAYTSTVPDFFCDETVLSAVQQGFAQPARTVTESIFRLKRSDTDAFPVELDEARQVKTVDGHPVNSDTLTGPSILVGAFSSSLSNVTLTNAACYDFQLVPNQRLHRNPVLVIDYIAKPSSFDDPFCPGREPHNGRAFIDPESFHVLRLEMVTPHHRVTPNIDGSWDWSIDYAEVSFDGRFFYMPKTIYSHAKSDDGRITWTFKATYRNYHKMHVTSRIITNPDTP